MSSVWQKIKSASGSGTQQTVTFVSQVLNRRNYKDLDEDNDEEVFTQPIPSESLQNASADDEDDFDAGVGQRRKYVLIIDESTTVTTTNRPDNTVDCEHSQDVITCENSQNEIKELGRKYQGIHQADVVPKIPSNATTSSCHLSENTETMSTTAKHVRRRRDSYDKALSEMTESYDRAFTDIIDYSQNTPTVLAVDLPQNAVDVDVIRSDESSQNSSGNPSHAFNSTFLSSKADSNPKTPLHRQISSVLQKDIPAAMQVIRNRNYSKLDDEIIEIEDESVSNEASNKEWQESFTAETKVKSKGRRRSKKFWKKTKKAARVTFKWLRRSIVTFGSSYNYGIPITVAMYGGSNRKRGRYDYR